MKHKKSKPEIKFTEQNDNSLEDKAMKNYITLGNPHLHLTQPLQLTLLYLKL